MQPDEYIENRVRQYQHWSDRKASSAKSRYPRMRGACTVAFEAHRDGAGADDAPSNSDPVPTAVASSAKGER